MKQTLAAVLAAAALTQSCSSPRSFLKEIYSRGSEAEHLFVNNDPQRLFRVHKSEEDGIADLQQLVADETFEEAWVFVPEDNEWWEVGRYSWEDQVGVYAVLDDTLLHALAGASREVTYYHFHPEKTIRRISGQPLGKPSAVTLASWALPSDIDLRTALVQFCYVADQFPGKSIRFKVASPAGIVEYTSVEEKSRELCSRGFLLRRDAINNAVAVTVSEVNMVDLANQLSRAFSLKESAFLHGGSYFEFEYTPYR